MINDSYVREEILVDPVSIKFLFHEIFNVSRIRKRIANISRVNDGNWDISNESLPVILCSREKEIRSRAAQREYLDLSIV